jgi:hypothetical protein
MIAIPMSFPHCTTRSFWKDKGRCHHYPTSQWITLASKLPLTNNSFPYGGQVIAMNNIESAHFSRTSHQTSNDVFSQFLSHYIICIGVQNFKPHNIAKTIELHRVPIHILQIPIMPCSNIHQIPNPIYVPCNIHLQELHKQWSISHGYKVYKLIIKKNANL